MDWIGWTTLAIAVVGATLGVFNAWWMIRRDTVRLRVGFVSIYLPHQDCWTYGVDVINTGYLAVTVKEVAVQRGRFSRKRGAVLVDYLGQVSLPHRLEPRSSITVAFHPAERARFEGGSVTFCRAATACGVVAKARIKRG